VRAAGTARPVARAAKARGDVSRRARERARREAARARAREKDVIARVPRPAPATRPAPHAAPAPVALTAAPAAPAAAASAPAAPATAQHAGEARYACERDVRSSDDIRVRCERLSTSDPRYDTVPPLEEQTAGATRVDLKD
jgi:hypothetical protein